MELGIKQFWKTAREKGKRFRIPILLALLGVLILLLPTGKERSKGETIAAAAPAADCSGEEARMEAILSQIDGAGPVRVMLTLKDEGCTDYQTDEQITTDDARSDHRSETVFSGGSQGSALIRSIQTPTYRGALIVSRGANDPQVCLDLVRAVGSLTGLTSDKITVLKMKG